MASKWIFQKEKSSIMNVRARSLQTLFMGMASLLLLSCQSKPLNRFQSIKLGQEKFDVLETLGGPNAKRFRNGVDHWYYRIYQDGYRIDREIDFLDDIVIYKGPPKKSFISAEEMDEINAKKERALLELEKNKETSKSPNKSRQ